MLIREKNKSARFKTGVFLLTLLMLIHSVLTGIFSAPNQEVQAQARAGETEATTIWMDQGAQDATGTINGSIWEDSTGSGGNMTSVYNGGGDTYLGNVSLFYQWIGPDGMQSPIYKTESRADGSFSNRVPDWVDVFGKTHSFSGNINKDKIRVWVDPNWLETNKLYQVMDSYNGGFGNYKFTKPTVWTGGKVTGYYLALQKHPDTTILSVPEAQVKDLGVTPESFNHANWINTFKGEVFWDWAYLPGATGDPMNTSGDIPAAGVTVYMSSSPTKDGTATKTWKVKTNSKGEFQFDVTKGTGHDGSIIVRDEYRVQYISYFIDMSDPALAHAAQWRPTGAQRFESLGVVGRGSAAGTNSMQGVKLALVPNSPKFEIYNYDTSYRLASKGDTAGTLATGYPPQSGVYQIRWDKVEVNDNGEQVLTQVHKVTNLSPNTAGTLPETNYTVPMDLQKTTLYQAVLINPNGEEMFFDAFIAIVTDVRAPIGAEGVIYIGQVVNPNQRYNYETKAVENLANPELKNHFFQYEIDTESDYAKENGFGGLPEGLTLDGNTGEITGTPAGESAGTYKVRFKIIGQGPATDGVTPQPYELFVERTIYILDGKIPNPAMEHRVVDNNIVKLETKTKGTLPANYEYKEEILELPNNVTYDSTTKKFGGTPAEDGDEVTTTHKVKIKYTVTYTDPNGSGKTIEDEVIQLEKDFVVLENLTIDANYKNGSVGKEFAMDAPITKGGEGPYAYTLDTPLPGLTINSETGVISGTPTDTGEYKRSITVTDKYGYTASVEGTIVIDNKSTPPEFNTVGDKDKTVTGTGIPGATVEVTFPDGTTKEITTVNPDGSWSVDVPDSITLKVDDELIATQKEPTVSVKPTSAYPLKPNKVRLYETERLKTFRNE